MAPGSMSNSSLPSRTRGGMLTGLETQAAISFVDCGCVCDCTSVARAMLSRLCARGAYWYWHCEPLRYWWCLVEAWTDWLGRVWAPCNNYMDALHHLEIISQRVSHQSNCDCTYNGLSFVDSPHMLLDAESVWGVKAPFRLARNSEVNYLP